MKFGRTTSAMLILSRDMRRHDSTKILRAHSTEQTLAMFHFINIPFTSILFISIILAFLRRSAARRLPLQQQLVKSPLFI